ncbi:MAG: pilin [Candidatus Gracilibacteria bacterium]|nr:pilin [Candidatus Gracilibacteria bacterium]
MKKILYYISYILSLAFYTNTYSAGDSTIKNTLLDTTSSPIGGTSGNTTSSILGPLFVWVKTEFFSLVMVLAIGVFIFIGIKFATAKGNPEEFKKAWLHLVYAIIGIFMIFMAWGLVKIVASLRI